MLDSDKSSGVTISHQMSTLYFPSDDTQGVRTDLKWVNIQPVKVFICVGHRGPAGGGVVRAQARASARIGERDAGQQRLSMQRVHKALIAPKPRPTRLYTNCFILPCWPSFCQIWCCEKILASTLIISYYTALEQIYCFYKCEVIHKL